MNVLYHFRTRGTGAEAVHIVGIARALEALGHPVTFCNPAGADPLRGRGSSPYGKPKRRGFISRMVDLCPEILFEFLELAYNVSAFRWIGRRLREGDFGMVYERHAFFLFATARLAARRGVPMVIEVNELVGDVRVRAQPLFAGLARRCDRRAFQAATLVVVVSPHLKRRIVDLGIDPAKILVLPNAVDPADYPPSLDGGAIRSRHGIRPGAVVIGFVGWFVAWHRLERLIECFAGLADTDPGLVLMLVGEGGLEEDLRERIGRLDIEDRVVFTGPVPHEEIPAHIAAMDISVVPHSNEYRSPIKLFEYMAMGRAVVAPATEPIATVVENETHGLLFDPESEMSLRRALRLLAQDADLRAKLGKAAREKVIDEHTWQANAKAILEAVGRGGVGQARGEGRFSKS